MLLSQDLYMALVAYVFMKTELRDPYKRFFGTLANQYRLEIIESLEKGKLNVTDLCKKTGLNQSTLSHNLQRLEECGFVFVKKKGKERIYSLNKRTIKPLLVLMHSHINQFCRRLCEDGNESKRNAL